jgi:hypothetical protein
MTVYVVIPLPKIPYIHRIYMVLANLKYIVNCRQRALSLTNEVPLWQCSTKSLAFVSVAQPQYIVNCRQRAHSLTNEVPLWQQAPCQQWPLLSIPQTYGTQRFLTMQLPLQGEEHKAHVGLLFFKPNKSETSRIQNTTSSSHLLEYLRGNENHAPLCCGSQRCGGRQCLPCVLHTSCT